MYTIAILILSTLLPYSLYADKTTQPDPNPIQRVVRVANTTDKTYKVFIKDGNSKYHEPIVLYPGGSQYMFCRTKDISSISFQPAPAAGKAFQIDKPLSEMMRVDCYDRNSLKDNFHFYLMPNNTIKSFPASSPQDLEIIEQVKNHTFFPPSRPFTTPFTKKP